MRYILILLTLLTYFILADDYNKTAIYEEMKNEPKVALVIGNKAYEKYPLEQTISDANNTKNFLESKGFKVIYAQNVKTKGAMRELINDFLDSIEEGVGLFYFSGHGMSANNENFMIPTENKSIIKDTDVEDIGLRVNYLLSELEKKTNRLNIVILDACRNSLGKGLGQPLLGNNASGVFIAYATAMGSEARDNGVFTSSFIKNASRAGLKIEDVFKRVRVEVGKVTEGKQIPFTSNGLREDFFFVLPKGSSSIIIINNRKENNDSTGYHSVKKEDNSLLWWLLGGLIIALVSLLFLLLKSKKETVEGIIEMNGLLYQNQPFTKQYCWQEAKKYATNLRLGKFDNWRLPTRDELSALGNIKFYGEYDDVFWKEWYQNQQDKVLINSKGEKHFVDKRFLENMPKDSYFWTSERKDEDDIWRVGFHLGCDDVSYDEDMNYVICVRDK